MSHEYLTKAKNEWIKVYDELFGVYQAGISMVVGLEDYSRALL